MITKNQDRIAAIAVAAFLLGGFALAASTPHVPMNDTIPTVDRGAVQCTTDSECLALESDRVLVGWGCAGGALVEYAAEEDEFSGYCDRIFPARVVGEWPNADIPMDWADEPMPLVCRNTDGEITNGADWKECRHS